MFPDFLTAVNFYRDKATTTVDAGVAFNSFISWGGAVGLPMQDGYHGPCRATRERHFFIGPPPNSFQEGLTLTVIMPASGTFVIEGGSSAQNTTIDFANRTTSNSVTFRTGRIPHCLNGGTPIVNTFDGPNGTGQATLTVDMPASIPDRFIQGNTITLLGQPVKYDAGALWEAIVWNIVIPYTSGLPPNGFSYAVNPAIYPHGTAITTNSPTMLIGSGSGFSSSPGLPSGLSLNTSTGNITGTPAGATARKIYTITCMVGGVTQTCQLDLTVT
jgi:hypothetical protein